MNPNSLYDNHGRIINYLRLAITDRCNLRCFYCMPEQGIDYVPRKELLTYEEMLRLVRMLSEMGIRKVRITGGEPFVRRDFMNFFRELSGVEKIESVHLTTNGTLTAPHVPELKALGIASVNLSLDTLDPVRFEGITRRQGFEKVWNTLGQLLEHEIPTKINMVVMEGRNEEDILPMAELSKSFPVSVRFIEEMPFNGSGSHYTELKWNFRAIERHLKAQYPELEKLADPAFSTSMNFKVPGYAGCLGIIPAFSRTFCGTCNRIRLTPQGMLKTCLYDDGVFNVRDLMRAGAKDEELKVAFLEALGDRAKDGFEAEKRRFGHRPISESMSTIGG